MATHSSILAWRIPWTKEPGKLVHRNTQSQTRLKWLSTAHITLWGRCYCPSSLDEDIKSYLVYVSNISICLIPVISSRSRIWICLTHVCMLNPLQLCLTLCDPMECSPLCSSAHGTLQARILEWVAIPSSRVSPTQWSNLTSYIYLHWQAGSLPLAPPGKSIIYNS